MKYAALFAGLIALAACNKGAQVDIKNADANQVSQAVKQSGVMDSGAIIEPGLWQSKVTVLDMNIPGIPPEYAAKMKQTLAEHRNQASTHCIKPEDVKKPKEDFFGADKSCRYEHFTMGGGKIDIQMVCKMAGSAQTTNMSGNYTPTTYAMDMSSSGNGGGQAMSMKMHVDSRRIGACTGKES